MARIDGTSAEVRLFTNVTLHGALNSGPALAVDLPLILLEQFDGAFWMSIYPKLLPVQREEQNPVRGDITFTWKSPDSSTNDDFTSTRPVKRLR